MQAFFVSAGIKSKHTNDRYNSYICSSKKITMTRIEYIVSKCNISEKGIEQTINLLDEQCTIPFIARYRKEVTGGLDEVEIESIVKLKAAFEVFTKRKETILKSIEEQGLLTSELQSKIEVVQDVVALEDLYLPFKKKRKTKAEAARAKGLEPLAKMIMSQNLQSLDGAANRFVGKGVQNIEEALSGAGDIIAEWISERTSIRQYIRKSTADYGYIESTAIKKQIEVDGAEKFKDYFDFTEKLKFCPSHRFLAVQRGQNEGFLRVKIAVDEDFLLKKIERQIIRSQGEVGSYLKAVIKDSFKRLLFPSISNEVITMYKEKADEDAIKVFGNNLKQILMNPPLGQKRVLAIDPGFRTGCKVVCLNSNGELLHNTTIFPHPPQNKFSQAKSKISELCEAYKIEAVAIGNGTASRETEHFIKQVYFKNNIEVFIVNEAGASIYSASKVGREEFPDYDITVRGAVSIGRRLMDPLSEYVKIDPKSIGVGQYQHDVDQKRLKMALDYVVMNCVNAIGVNLNTSSKYLLSYIAGISESVAEKIVAHREEKGGFSSRSELLNVSGLGNKAFEQAAGFLRVKDGENILDNTNIHPESYAIAEEIAKKLSLELVELIGNEAGLSKIQFSNMSKVEISESRFDEVLTELKKPSVDPRSKAKIFAFSKYVKTIVDLKLGIKIPGIINNITNFGCFVDIGIKETGLIHISNLKAGFVNDVNDVVSLNEKVLVEVLEVDTSRKRIQLKLVNKIE